MEQYIPYSLLCDLFNRNLETYLHLYATRKWLFEPELLPPPPPQFALPAHGVGQLVGGCGDSRAENRLRNGVSRHQQEMMECYSSSC